MALNRRHLSESTDGRGIKVAATATAGTLIHTGSSTDGDMDEVYIYAYNSHTSAVVLTLEWGGTTDPDDHIVKTIPPDDGAVLVAEGFSLGGATTPLNIRAFAGTANVVVLHGWVNRFS